MKLNRKQSLFLIYFVSACLFLVLRYVVSVLPLGDNWIDWIFSIFSQIGLNVLLVVLLYNLFNRDNRLGDIKEELFLTVSKRRFPPITIVIVAILPFVMRYATLGVSYASQVLISAFGFTSVSSVGTLYTSPEVLVISIITTAVLPAFCEEFYNRGVLLAATKDRPDDIYKVLFVGVMFGLFHQNIQQFFYTIFGGCVFALLTIKFRSIWPAVYCHFINNFLDVIYDYSSQKGNAIGVLYDGYYDFVNEHFLIGVGSWFLAFLIVIGLMIVLARLIPSEEPMHKEEKFGVSIGKSATDRLVPISQVKKPVFREYGFVIASMVLMGLSTVFTFVWGVLR